MVRSGMLVDQDGNQNGIYLPAINYCHAHSVVHKDNQNCQLENPLNVMSQMLSFLLICGTPGSQQKTWLAR